MRTKPILGTWELTLDAKPSQSRRSLRCRVAATVGELITRSAPEKKRPVVGLPRQEALRTFSFQWSEFMITFSTPPGQLTCLRPDMPPPW